MKTIKIYNTLSRSKEEVVPEQDSLIRMYSCGLTVYDFAHIGNLRKYVFDDLLRRTLEYFGYQVKHVMNVTDVGHLTSDADEGEDKIEKGAAREGKNAWDVAKYFEKVFVDDLKKLNIEAPEVMPRATEHIKEQVDLIKKLEEKGFTYKTSDGIYFDTSKLDDYGKLAGLDKEGLKEGARVEVNIEKKNPTDFALWKLSKGDCPLEGDCPHAPKRDMEWESPWGVGFPGWHIECSAMSTKYLGQPFEIHTGGVDHINVHHTNEIAQSEAAYDKPLAKYWVHSEHLLEGGRKMAKSDGHFIRLQDVVERGFDPLDLRYFYLTAHYRSKLDFSWESLAAAKAARSKITDFAVQIDEKSEGSDEEKGFYSKALNDFETAISDDLDTPKALAIVFSAISGGEVAGFKGLPAIDFLQKIDKILAIGILANFDREVVGDKFFLAYPHGISSEIVVLAKKRIEAKANSDFIQADNLRKNIENKGFILEDSSNSTLIKRK